MTGGSPISGKLLMVIPGKISIKCCPIPFPCSHVRSPVLMTRAKMMTTSVLGILVPNAIRQQLRHPWILSRAGYGLAWGIAQRIVTAVITLDVKNTLRPLRFLMAFDPYSPQTLFKPSIIDLGNLSLTWILRPFGDDFLYRPWFLWGCSGCWWIKFTLDKA